MNPCTLSPIGWRLRECAPGWRLVDRLSGPPAWERADVSAFCVSGWWAFAVMNARNAAVRWTQLGYRDFERPCS